MLIKDVILGTPVVPIKRKNDVKIKFYKKGKIQLHNNYYEDWHEHMYYENNYKKYKHVRDYWK